MRGREGNVEERERRFELQQNIPMVSAEANVSANTGPYRLLKNEWTDSSPESLRFDRNISAKNGNTTDRTSGERREVRRDERGEEGESVSS